ncbi:MAG: bifunctional alpha,alpha-trehalose-phosphate synthase (UDP-forming)/trehalose-phosphatase [Deltaproteobacteria bacterium]|nr:bifunctional alpha,alpha-trehalose-phosphate synthase (UDP-forming)/trehalose-phosphatase [Deltaproteobacteria bacterium]
MSDGVDTGRRLVVVSNRLPFNVSVENGRLRFHESAGGLVTGLAAYIESRKRARIPSKDHVWVGWPGSTVEGDLRDLLRTEALAQFQSYPVFLSEKEMEHFYLGFCNKTLWPLFHYFTTFTAYDENSWQQYKHVNQVFCETLSQLVRQDDLVWIHDYHLMLLPRLLKARMPELSIGFFLHIPFPSFEVFRLLPARWRREILEGVLGADLIGFHTYEYTHHFLQSVLRILGHEHHMGQIVTSEKVVKVETFPMGIDFSSFVDAVDHPDIQQEAKTLRDTFPQIKIILSVDRLDYSKGIPNRLRGFEIFLEKNARYHGKVVLLMVVVPSRIGVDQYDRMKRQIEELVGKINGRFGRIDWTPIVYQYRYVPFPSLVALYSVADICLVTPLRDGMNLVAKEYVATRKEGTGVLILSEMAGASKELGDALIVNPNNREEIAEAINEALGMGIEEQKKRNELMQRRLRRYNVMRWANDFVKDLMETRELQERMRAKLLSPAIKREMIERYTKSRRRVLFLDYDGTMALLVRHPSLARPDENTLGLLRALSADPKNVPVIISGRDRTTLQAWFGHLPIGLVAEHGLWRKRSGEKWRLSKFCSSEWKTRLLPILEDYADRLPGAAVEEKEYSIAWHYRSADPDQAFLVAAEMTDHLVNLTAKTDLQVLQGSKVIEIRNTGINKGATALDWLLRDHFDFVLAMGDDWTDEDLFRVLPDSAFSIRVGVVNTNARYNLATTHEVIDLLRDFVG